MSRGKVPQTGASPASWKSATSVTSPEKDRKLQRLVTTKATSEAQNRLEKEYGSMFKAWQKAALGESSGITGGYIVPPDFGTVSFPNVKR